MADSTPISKILPKKFLDMCKREYLREELGDTNNNNGKNNGNNGNDDTDDIEKYFDDNNGKELATTNNNGGDIMSAGQDDNQDGGIDNSVFKHVLLLICAILVYIIIGTILKSKSIKNNEFAKNILNNLIIKGAIFGTTTYFGMLISYKGIKKILEMF